MDWSGRRLLFGGGGVEDNTMGERGRFCRADLSFGNIAHWQRRSATSSLLHRLTRRGGLYTY